MAGPGEAMFDLSSYLLGLAAMAVLAFVTWAVSVAKRDVGIVDRVWGLFFLLGALVYAATVPAVSARAVLVLVLVTLWSVRLAAYITWRGWGEPEDHRYQIIRRRNQPSFALKSLYLVFGLQALLAWIVSLPLLAAVAAPSPLGAFDYAGAALWVLGFLFETVGDLQLARFKSDPANHGRVMDGGLWRYTRHPNYFGEFCLWWGFYLVAVAGGGWWSVASPLVMSFLLLKVSGVAMLERNIGERRPGYREYVARTPTFFPGPPRKTATTGDVP